MISKGNKSLTKKIGEKSQSKRIATRNTVFYHKASAGQLTIDLNSLSMPSEINMAQATSQEIAGAQLYSNKKNLKLLSSLNGELMLGIDFDVASSTAITLKGPYAVSGAEDGEIFIGTVQSTSSEIIVASAKGVQKSYTLAAGQTLLSLGQEYTVGDNADSSIGSIKVFVDGILAERNTSNSSTVLDKDYYEIAASGGYGTTIQFNVAPTQAKNVVVDFGTRSITDSNAIGTIESLSGSIKKLADDLAIVAGTSASDYFDANPSEIERRAFGDMVLSFQSQITDLTSLAKKKRVMWMGYNGGLVLSYGSTNTRIVNIANPTMLGDWSEYFTITNSTTLGTTFVAKKRFMLDAVVGLNHTGSSVIGLSVNSTELTTGYLTISENDKMTAFTGLAELGSCVGYRVIEIGDVIRLHTQAQALVSDSYFRLIFKVDESI